LTEIYVLAFRALIINMLAIETFLSANGSHIYLVK
ncbi:MAG: hypothetical protein ACI805_000825, partial [Candidatus Azotimanducaceae bacterium]